METKKFLVGYSRTEALASNKKFKNKDEALIYAKKTHGGSIWLETNIQGIDTLEYIDYVETEIPSQRPHRAEKLL